MTDQELRDKITWLAKQLQVSCGEVFYNSVLKPKFIKLDVEIFDKMCKWLSNIDNFKSTVLVPFPNIPYFDKAKRATSNYTPSTFSEEEIEYAPQSEVKKVCRELAKKFSVKKKNKNSQVQLMKFMAKKDMVFSYHYKKWISLAQSDNCAGKFLDPKKQLKLMGIDQ